MDLDSTHIDNLIVRYLAGEASEKDWEELSLWMENSPENKKYFEGIKFVHDKAVASHRVIKVDVDKAWQKMTSQMLQPEKTLPVKTVNFPVYKFWFRIAASLALLIGLSALLFWILKPTKAIETYTYVTTDTISRQTLADKTEITLNRNSKITFNTKKNIKRRELELTGEAFIKVHHSADTILLVKAGETLIRDIGTAFNVKAYPEKQTVEVIVESGEVAFYTSENKGLTLKAGESGIYNKLKKEFTKPDAVDINALSYKSKLFVFRDTPLKKAISALNSVYKENIELANPQLNNCTITVTFESESPEAIADIIAETLKLTVTQMGDKFVLSGECSNQP